MTIEHFFGHWKMDAEQNHYEAGTPPTEGEYIISPQDDQMLFEMRWTTVDGQEQQLAYTASADAEWHPVADAQSGETMRLYLEEPNKLVSEVQRDGEIIAYASRVLDDDQQSMTVKQKVITQGETFTNTSVYKRIN